MRCPHDRCGSCGYLKQDPPGEGCRNPTWHVFIRMENMTDKDSREFAQRRPSAFSVKLTGKEVAALYVLSVECKISMTQAVKDMILRGIGSGYETYRNTSKGR